MPRLISIIALGIVLALAAGDAFAQFSQGRNNQRNSFRVRLDGNQEVLPVSTTGNGSLVIHIARDGNSLDYELEYDDLVSPVQVAHIHFGRPAINAGVMVFLCSNMGGAPAATPACPGPTSGEVSGTLDADDVVGPAGQGIAAGEFAEVVEALRSRAAYVNVHTTLYPGGEIRGDIVR
jgi:hypothetical protein